MKLFKNKFFAPLLIIPVVLIIFSLAGYFWVTKKSSIFPKPPGFSEERDFSPEEVQKATDEVLQKEIEKFSANVPKISTPACLVVPKINPRTGAHQFKNNGNDVYEMYYRGTLLDAASYTKDNCDYYQFKLAIKGTDYDITFYLPKGLKGSGVFSEVDGQLLANRKDQEITLRIVYRSMDTNWKDLQSDLQIVSWEIAKD